MARRQICEWCQSIDVRRLFREGGLHPGRSYPLYFAIDGNSFGGIKVRTQRSSINLTFQFGPDAEGTWKSVEQEIPILWTPCHLGGQRAWFCCRATSDGEYCGRRVAILYLASNAGFACRRCYGLSYASQSYPAR